MNRFLVFSLLVGCALAAPYTASSSSSSTSAKSSTVAILKHIQQINDDGSYTFGYENADGSYRVENRDVSGYITGKYGYIDGDGKLQETEYVAGKLSGRSVGYQARGSLIPIYSREQLTTFPVVRTVSTEQRALDYEYKSVDADEDGFPDDAPVAVKTETYQTAPVVVRVVEQPVAKASGYGSKTVTKVQEPKATYEVEKIRAVEPVAAVKTVEYSSTSSVSSSESATASSDAVITDVRTPAVESEKVEAVQVVEPTPTIVRVVETAGTAKYVQQQPAVVRLVATETEPSVKQVVESAPRQTSHLYKVNQSVFRLPTAATTYETAVPVAKVVEKKVSVGRLDAFLRELVKNGNNVRITYQQPKTGTSYYAQQPSTVETTLVADDDSIDIDAFGRII